MMLDKIRAVMRVYGMVLPRPVREVIEEIGAEVDRLRAELDQVKQHNAKGIVSFELPTKNEE
jgi:hypothetical protein